MCYDIVQKRKQNNYIYVTPTILQPLYMTTCINWPSVKNGRILLEQSFTAHMLLLTAAGEFVLRRRC